MDQELSLINKVELRIALADSDEKFQESLRLYLAPLLLKLASPHQQIRNAIFKTMSPLITRLNGAPLVKVPIDALLSQVKNPNTPHDPLTVQLYSLVFVSKGLDRTTPHERNQVISTVTDGISHLKPQIQARLFNIACRLIASDGFEGTVSLNPEDQRFLIEKFTTLFLLVPGQSDSGCPGLSAKKCAFLEHDAGVSFTSSHLRLYKHAILKFVLKGFKEDTSFLLLVASADGDSAIADEALSLLKKCKRDYEDVHFVERGFRVFFGDKASTNETLPAKPVLQEKILSSFCRSKRAALHPQAYLMISNGLESDYGRLKQTSMQFLQWTISSGPENPKNDTVAEESVAQQVKELLSSGDIAVGRKGLYYEALGQLLRKNKNLPDWLEYVKFLFEALLHERPDLRITIQGALSGLSEHLPFLSLSDLQTLKKLIKFYLSDMESENKENLQACRYIAIKYINCGFPFQHAEARLLNILGTDPRNGTDIIDEAHKGLHPYWFRLLRESGKEEVEFPKFSEMAEVLPQGGENANVPILVVFSWRCLIVEAIQSRDTVIVPDEEWQTRIDKAIEVDQQVRELTTKRLAQCDKLVVFLTFILEHLANDKSSGAEKVILAKMLYQIISLSPSSVVATLTEKVDVLISCYGKNSSSLSLDLLEYLGKSTAIVCTHPEVETERCTDIVENRIQSSSAGDILLVGLIVSRLFLRGRASVISTQALSKVFSVLIASLGSNEENVVKCALISLSQCALFGVLDHHCNSPDDLTQVLQQIADALLPKVKKQDEKSLIPFSLVAILCEQCGEDLNIFEKTVYDTHTSKQIDFIFTSGEAMSILGVGRRSKFLQNQIDIQGASLVQDETLRLSVILDCVFAACSNTKPSLRKAACVWLLSLVQYCYDFSDVQARASQIQAVFMQFLADRDEIVQEVASKGLSLIYEKGNKELQDDLVHGLLTSFASSSNGIAAGSVGAETELFEPGVLRTNEGSVSTYRDVLNLASEAGDPSLVYKFMSLARNSALWSSRKGLAFGLGSILSKTKLEDLFQANPALFDRLIPKLYRYRYDPNPSVRQSMNEIWTALLPNPTKTIDENYSSILKELLRGMGDKEWRTRQASAAALSDLLQRLPLDSYEHQLIEIWNMSFRVMDDVKESVRQEGTTLTRRLVSKLVRYAGENSSKEASEKVFEQLIPFLLGPRALLSDAEEVRSFSLQTILSICKESNSTIKPFIPGLVNELVLLMSSLEPQIVNYLSLNASKYNLETSELDAKRLQSVGHSPLMDALENLLTMVDELQMKEVVLAIEKAIKGSVGLPSKAAGSRLIVTLVVKHLLLIKPYGDQLVAICRQQTQHSNSAVALTYATTLGYVCRVASIATIVDLSTYLQNLYFKPESEEARKISAVASESISRHSRDRFHDVASSFLPFAFVAKHDSVASVREPYEREWDDNTTGRGAVRLYLKEIVALVSQNLQCQQFGIRQVCAQSIADACASVGDIESLGSATLENLFQVLVDACKGRSWTGKEDVVNALVSLCCRSKTFLSSGFMEEDINGTLLTEAKRRNKQYQRKAVKALAQYIPVFPQDGLIEEYIEIVKGMIDEDDVDSDGEDQSYKKAKTGENGVSNTKKEEQRIDLIACSVRAVSVSDGGNFSPSLVVFVLNCLCDLYSTSGFVNTWRSHMCVCQSLSHILEVFVDKKVATSTLVENIQATWSVILEHCGSEQNTENVLISFVRVCSKLLNYLGDLQGQEEFTAQIQSSLKALSDSRISPVVKVEISKVVS